MKNKDPISHKILTGGPGPPGALSLYYYLSFFFNIYIHMVIFEGPDPDADSRDIVVCTLQPDTARMRSLVVRAGIRY